MSEILQELAEHSPNSTPDQIAKAVVDYLERSIPEVIVRLRLPGPPSATQARLLEMMLKRMKSGRRVATRTQVSAHDKILSELRYFRYRLNGHGSATTSVSAGHLWDVAPTAFLEDYEMDGQPSLENDSVIGIRESLDSRVQENKPQRLHPYSSLETITQPTRVRSFVYDEGFVAKLLSEPDYERIARALEEASRDFAERSGLDWSFELLVDSDVEMPSWKRLVMRLSVSTSDFDEKLKLWDDLDQVVREKIRRIGSEFPSYGKVAELFSKSLYLRMDIG